MEQFKVYLSARGYREATINLYVSNIKPLVADAVLDANITYQEIISIIETHQPRLSPRSLNILIRSIEYYLDSLGLENNPCRNIRMKNVQRKVIYHLLDTDQLDRIYQTYRETPGKVSLIKHGRNTVVLGLFIYQAIRAGELYGLSLEDIDLGAGKVRVHSVTRGSDRLLILEPCQILDLHLYIEEQREELLLDYRVKESDLLFPRETMPHLLVRLIERLQRRLDYVESLKQIRASRITLWLNDYHLRKVQYMAGHKYVTTTESYSNKEVRLLQEQLPKYHPLDNGVV